jgi:hypothetical protein
MGQLFTLKCMVGFEQFCWNQLRSSTFIIDRSLKRFVNGEAL